MKILHSAALISPSPGICAQMLWEAIASKNLKSKWDVKIFCPLGSDIDARVSKFSRQIEPLSKSGGKWSIIQQIVFSWEYHRWLKSVEDEFDIYLLRYQVYDVFQMLFVMFSRKPVFFVHHTLELPELAMVSGFFGKVKFYLEKYIGPLSIRRSLCTVGMTREIVEYERSRSSQPRKDFLLYPNGIVYGDNILEDKRDTVPEFLFLASYFASWHGLDILIKKIRENDRIFILHVIGEVSRTDIEMAEVDSRIIFHGSKNQDEIRHIAEHCWVGLSSFALFRKNMREACTLKVREYLEMGLPVYSGHKDVFPEKFEFYRNSELSIDDLMTFALSMINVSRRSVAQDARVYIDKFELLNRLSGDINNFSGLMRSCRRE